jgi:hypothetical protein
VKTEELDPKKIKIWNWYNKERQKQFGIVRPQTKWEEFLGFGAKVVEPETYLGLAEKVGEWAGKGWQEYLGASKEFPEKMAMESGERFKFIGEHYIQTGRPIPPDDLDFVNRYLERHVNRPPGFTAQQWLQQPEALQKGYNYAVLATILAMPIASVISHPTFGPRVKFALNKLYRGKPPKFTRVVTKGYSLAGKPETKVKWEAIKPARGAASITREVTAELAAIKPAIQKTVKTLQFKNTVHKQLYDLVSKYKPNPTPVDMQPFYKTADRFIGAPTKGLINPAYAEITYNLINK